MKTILKDLIKIANKLDNSGFFKEADVLDSIIRKSATPREMDDELRKALDAGELADINEDRASSEKLNYLDLVDKVGPIPEDIKSGVKRITMSNNKISRIGNFTQSNGRKPRGLWYACGNEWLSWSRYEMPDWIGKYVYSIDVNEGSILNIRTYKELEEFDEAYRIKSEKIFGEKSFMMNAIDWGKVAKEYDGIEICPYIYEARYSMDWYSTWDVASGCIWRPSAVQSIKLIAEKTSDTIKPEGLEGGEIEYPRKEDSPNWVMYK